MPLVVEFKSEPLTTSLAGSYVQLQTTWIQNGCNRATDEPGSLGVSDVNGCVDAIIGSMGFVAELQYEGHI